MKTTLSTRHLALIAVCLAVASAVSSFRWAARYTAKASRYHREVNSVEEKQDALEHNVVNLAALLMMSAENALPSGRPLPTIPQYEKQCSDIASSVPLFRTFEAARANAFIIWYFLRMQKFHHTEAPTLPSERGGTNQ